MKKAESFKPDNPTVRELLTNSYNFYIIPEYQRPYKWKEDNINKLIKDIKESMETGEYFIGSIILVKNSDGYHVIDGQQRLITLILILSAIYKKYGFKELKKCFFDEDQDRYRVAPRVDQRNDFHEGVLSKILNNKEPEDDVNNIFAETYRITKDLLIQNEIFVDEQEAGKYYKYLLDNVSLISIYNNSESFAIKLFYVMNTTGTSLSNDEVIKVILYGKLNDIDRNTFMVSWDEIQSIQKELNSIYFGFNKLEKIFILYSYYYLAAKPKTLVYDTYSKMISKGESPLNIIYKVKQFANSLLELNNNSDSKNNEEILDNRVLFPLYSLYDTEYWQVILGTAVNVNYNNIRELGQELLRLYYLNWISGRNTGNIRDILMGILKLVKDKESISDIVKIIEDKINIDNLEEQAIERLNDDVYVKSPIGWLKPVLSLIEYSLYDDSGVNYISEGYKDSPSIDHILPVSWDSVHYWTEHWSENDANKWVYKLGNMTLISPYKNSKIGNADFLTKKEYYTGKIGDGKSTKYQITVLLNDLQDWNAEECQKRQEWMVKSLMEILKRT